jgi:GTPase SAR1 family protein
MTGIEPFAGPVIKEVIHQLPTGYALLKSWLTGKQVLIIGQPRAGKTTFREYLEYGLFDDEKPTQETAEIEATRRVNLGIGRDSRLKLNISAALDTPGQVGAVEHANLAFERNPHALLIVLDLTKDLEGEPDRASATWLKRFCKRYEAKWRVDRKRKSRLQAMIVIMSKADRVDQAVMAERRNAFQKTLNDELRDAKGKILGDIPVLPCSMVANTITNPSGTKMMDAVIAELAKTVSR